MTFDNFRNFCLSFRGVTEETPFDERTLVYKGMGKMFALTDLHDFNAVNLKCDPDKALDLRERYEAVTAGYHMNKKHWNTVAIGGDAPDSELYDWIRHSYDLVYASLPKKLKEELAAME